MGELQLAGGQYKLGGWYQNGTFADRRGNGGLYAIADRKLWRAGARALNGFLRVGGAPSDRNLVKSYVDAGSELQGACSPAARRTCLRSARRTPSCKAAPSR